MRARSPEETQEHLARLYQLQQRIRDEIALIEAGYIGRTDRKPRRSKWEEPGCGTETAYQRHKYRGEQCDECKHAHAKHERLRAAFRRTQQQQEVA